MHTLMMSLRRSTRVLTRTLTTSASQETESVVIIDKPTTKQSRTVKTKKRSRKDMTEETSAPSSPFKKPKLPTTPLRKTSKPAIADVLTPTLGLAPAAGLLDLQASKKAASPLVERPVRPHVTNATLVTPGGSKRVAFPSLSDESPSKTGLPPPIATTNTLLQKACAHLVQVDDRLQRVIDKHPCEVFSAEGLAEKVDPFQEISSGIMGQQVSGAAARSIRNKFIALFHEDDPENKSFPMPTEVAVTEIARLRLAGLSGRKAEYIQGLAQKFASGELSTDMLLKATDEEVMEKLIAVRGLGKWSVEMFSCFGLKRTDIFSTGDLGIQRGMAVFYGKDVKRLKAKGGKWKYMSEQEMLERSAPFAPYRSIFMWYMWKFGDVDIDVLQAA